MDRHHPKEGDENEDADGGFPGPGLAVDIILPSQHATRRYLHGLDPRYITARATWESDKINRRTLRP